jgi:hypothetical protein
VGGGVESSICCLVVFSIDYEVRIGVNQCQYEEYPDKSSYDLVFFLNTWLAEHIMKDDKLLGEYLVKKGLSMEAAQKSWFKRVFG